MYESYYRRAREIIYTYAHSMLLINHERENKNRASSRAPKRVIIYWCSNFQLSGRVLTFIFFSE